MLVNHEQLKIEDNRMNELREKLAQKLIPNQDDEFDGVDHEETVKWVCDLLSFFVLFSFLYHFFFSFLYNFFSSVKHLLISFRLAN